MFESPVKQSKFTKDGIIQQHIDTVSAMRAISPFVIFAVIDVRVLTSV